MGALFLRHRVEQLADDVEKMQQANTNKPGPIDRHMQRRGRRNSGSSMTSGTGSSYATSLTTMSGGGSSQLDKRAAPKAENFDPLDPYTSAQLGRNKKAKSSCRMPPWGLCRERDAENGFDKASSRFCPRRRSRRSKELEQTEDKMEPISSLSASLVNAEDERAPTRTGQAARVIVADVSLLIYSLRTVHELLKAGDCRVVVPCEALCTLDVLKKGEHFLNLAARRAIRFLDERFSASDATHKNDAVLHQSALKPGLYPQSVEHGLVTFTDETSAKVTETLKGAPMPVAKTLACALFLVHRYADTPDVTCSLAIALPPPHLDFEDERTAQDEGGDDKHSNLTSLCYADRADGNLALQWSKACGLTNADGTPSPRLIVAPTAASWLAASPRVPVEGAHRHAYGHHILPHHHHHGHHSAHDPHSHH